MLLNNWNPATGLVRDKTKDPSGAFDAIQVTGSLAAATALAEQLGVVSPTDAQQIVNKIGETLLLDLPRYHGLWPHWVKTSPGGEITIVPGTEWSSVDTVIAAIGLLTAQSGLGLDTSGAEKMLQTIGWEDLVLPTGISHGYTYTGDLIPYTWDVFGGESWLVELGYVSVSGRVAPVSYPSPPTANGSGFIDELAWLFVPPPSGEDYWGTDWASYLSEAADNQVTYSPTHYPQSCYAQLGWFGLSAGEVPDPASVPQDQIYQPFGIGGQFSSENDGTKFSGVPVMVPHYAAMIAYLHPQEALKMWDWLIDHGYFSPLSNVESLQFPKDSGCDPSSLVWNQLKGSWNLSLQTLGWGRYLADRTGEIPVLWQATIENPFLHRGYALLIDHQSNPASVETIPIQGAVYIPKDGETSSTPIWKNTQPDCTGLPLNQWRQGGIYLYKGVGSVGSDVDWVKPDSFTRTYPSIAGYACESLDTELFSVLNNIGEALPNFPKTGTGSSSTCRPNRGVISGGGNITTSFEGNAIVKSGLSSLPAARFDITFHYSFGTGLHDYFELNYHKSEWYVCGVGLVKSTALTVESKNWMKIKEESSTLRLVSFTPKSTNESQVRYILTDIQLGTLLEYYRENADYEEAAEAIRRWDGGVRLLNIDDFERKVVNGMWQIVYQGTETQIRGLDCVLNSD